MPHDFSFTAELKFSSESTVNHSVTAVLLAEVPGAVIVTRATAEEDRRGTDYWVSLATGKRVSVDTKVRRRDFGLDDLALETWSVVEERRIGWTRDASKDTDYVLWLWEDSGKWRLVPFAMLCAVFIAHWSVWRKTYRRGVQRTTRAGRPAYHSEVVFVPRVVIWRAIYQQFSGERAA